MITIQTTEGIAYVPEFWSEVTLSGFYHAWSESDATLLIEGETLAAIEIAKPYTVLNFDAVSYTHDCVNVDNIVQNFGLVEWHKFLELEQGIQAKDAGSILQTFDNTFTAEEYNAMPCTYGVNAVIQLLTAYHDFLQPYKMSVEYSEAQLNAGVERLAKLGVWGAISGIAETYGLDPEQVLAWNVRKVYTELFYRHEKSMYLQRLNEQAQSNNNY
jgi:hypothetical protein